MKKYLFLFSALVSLAACNSGTNDSKDSSRASSAVTTTQTSSVSTSATSATSEMKQANNNSDKTSATTSSKTDSPHQNHALSAIDELKANYPNQQFPDPIMIDGGKPVGIMASEEQGILTVHYYQVTEETPFNDPTLQDQTPIAEFQRETFDSKTSAQEQVGQTYDPNGQQVDLGHNLTGYQTAGAGSSFLNWKEGNWSLAVRANNLEQENPVPLAKQAVEYLETAFLPVPRDAGQISLQVTSSDYQSNRVVWQNEQQVYTIMNRDSMNSLKMAVSMTN
ncbi:hypothetical protein P7H00_07360 [Enterococcus pseudoavium]|uniref:Lipoprotein n=1 Tax=Enterococcus pseudoavium TaxID=44007 RepID=A0AAE4I1W6_9ENTE|nr:lipoprotein [Enterococcus pseudoavium]MDT2736942.1 hypothetical protein [Enterococcus pseudoavium]